MIRCASLHTYELDDPATAAAELNAQLAAKLELLENTVAVLLCHQEFCAGDYLEQICRTLPFDVAGVTTAAQCVNDGGGDQVLTLLVMTADDVVFKTGVTDCLLEDVSVPTREAYAQASAGMDGLPALALIFPPLILKYGGDIYTEAWDELLPGVPVFGTIAIDDTLRFDESETVFCGKHYFTCMSFILCYGNLRPRFLVGTLPSTSLMPYQGEITSSDGPLVHTINHITPYDFYEELGLGHDSRQHLLMPVMLDLKKRANYDSIPVVRTLAAFNKDKTAIFRGYMDKNAILTISKCTEEDVLSATREQAKSLCALEDVHGVLTFSCIIRRMVSGNAQSQEITEYSQNMRRNVPYMLGYAGGEICPTSMKDGAAANRFHNQTLISLIL